MGLDAGQVRDLIVRPALEYLGLPGGIAAEKLVLGTAAQESKFKYLKQLGKGPALGIFQMEPATFFDLWGRVVAQAPLVAGSMGLGERVASLSVSYKEATPKEMTWNLRFACAMCRIHYFMRKKLVIREDADMPTIAGWWKSHFNTYLGKGTPEEFLRNWKTTGCDKLYS